MAIIIYTGRMGSGKSMLGVQRARKIAKARGAALFSNITIRPPEGVPFVKLADGHDGFDSQQLEALITSAKESGSVKGAVVMLDEIGLLMWSRKWQTFPPNLMRLFTQMRKFKTDLIATSQYEALVDGTVRLNAQEAFLVRCIPASSLEKFEKGVRPKLFRLTSYVPGHVGERAHRLDAQWIIYRRAWEEDYDTDEMVGVPERMRTADDARLQEWMAWAREALTAASGGANAPQPALVAGDGASRSEGGWV